VDLLSVPQWIANSLYQRTSPRLQAGLTGLEDHEEDSEESGQDDVGPLSGESMVVLRYDDEVRTLSGPERRGSQTDQHRGRYHRRPDLAHAKPTLIHKQTNSDISNSNQIRDVTISN